MSPNNMTRNTVFSQRKHSNNSLAPGSPMRAAKVKSSLMGTSARQKLLQIKLMQQEYNNDLKAEDKKAIK